MYQSLYILVSAAVEIENGTELHLSKAGIKGSFIKQACAEDKYTTAISEPAWENPQACAEDNNGLLCACKHSRADTMHALHILVVYVHLSGAEIGEAGHHIAKIYTADYRA